MMKSTKSTTNRNVPSVERRESKGTARPVSYHPGRHINPTGYELDSELEIGWLATAVWDSLPR